MKIAMGDTRVTAHELRTFMFEAASMANEVPLSIGAPRADGTFPVITPNNLLIGRLGICLPEDTVPFWPQAVDLPLKPASLSLRVHIIR